MIRAIFFDIDGTLLSFKTHRVSPGTVAAFEKLHQREIRTFIASGRPEVLIPPMPIRFDGLCTMNGGYVIADGAVLLNNPLPREESDRWLHYCQEHKICTMMFTEHEMFACNIDDRARALQAQLEFEMPQEVDLPFLIGKDAYQIIAIVPPTLDATIQQLMPHSRTPRWCDVFTDVVHRDNSKAEGLAALCRHFGIRQEETMAIGDGANDIEMLEWSAIGVAMGNADDEVKRHARWVTTDVDHEGIAHAIDRMLELEALRQQLHNYEELLCDMSNDSSYVARGNGFCDTKYSEDFLEGQIAHIEQRIAELE